MMPYQKQIVDALDQETVVCVKQPTSRWTMTEFARAMLDNVASRMGLTYEQFSQDYAQGEYSMALASMRAVARSNAERAARIQARLTIIYFSPRGPRIRELLSSHTGRRRRRGERLMQRELQKPMGYFWKSRPARGLIVADEVDAYRPGYGGAAMADILERKEV